MTSLDASGLDRDGALYEAPTVTVEGTLLEMTGDPSEGSGHRRHRHDGHWG